jgi:hypothetical protein
VEIRQRLLRHIDAQGERKLRRSHQIEKQLNRLEMRILGKLAGNDIAPNRVFVGRPLPAAAAAFSGSGSSWHGLFATFLPLVR